jgi:3D (Asp-Asp-Asp) domain-containing protein
MLLKFSKSFVVATLFSIGSIACATENSYQRDPLDLDTFSYLEPKMSDLGKEMNLWATYYYTAEKKEEKGDFPLRNMQSTVLGPYFSKKSWCMIALEGSVRVLDTKGVAKTYNYAGTTSANAINCKEYFKYDVSKTKFNEAQGPWGDGLLNQYILSPFRTLATDANFIKPGTILYIPSARGTSLKLPNGKMVTHDGYFFAGDKGGAIKGNHIDVFIGTDLDAPYFKWIGSNQSKTFKSYIVNDPKIIAELTALHVMYP